MFFLITVVMAMMSFYSERNPTKTFPYNLCLDHKAHLYTQEDVIVQVCSNPRRQENLAILTIFYFDFRVKERETGVGFCLHT